ncbi:MAG: class IV adenylate cyclase [Methanobacterium sp.]|jgi:adenylate cyclase class 2|nr:class IV adenylate cyclase [Methanobacterium sp.]
MIEVEVKARAPEDLLKMEDKLVKIGAKRVKKEYQEDLYFNAPHRDFAETDEALRIRKVKDNHSEKIFITYKGAKMDNVSKTREEIEVGVADPVKVADIFKNLSFRPVATVRKNRIIYSLNELVITLDKVEGVGSFMEIEKETEEDGDIEGALNDIFATYSQIGIEEGFERRSYLELMGI